MDSGAPTGVGTDDRRPKRQRTSGSEHALVSCFDEPDKMVEVNLRLVESFECRLASLLKHTEPEISDAGKRFWRSGMTRSMLLTMLSSMTYGELVLSNGVSIGEALVAFDYEGLCVNNPKKTSRRVEHPRMGVAFSKLEEPVSDTVRNLCEQVASAIVSWPRLRFIMESYLPENADSHVTCTPSRAWLMFADRPKSVDVDGQMFIISLVCKWPRWFSEGLVALGIIHYRMSQVDPDFGRCRDENSFRALCAEVESDPLGCFYCTRMDSPKHCMRKDITKGEKFANEIKQSILQFSHESEPGAKPSMQVQYARAIVTFVENSMNTMFNCSKVFSCLCSDDSGSSMEHIALKRALEARGVTVVRWMDERDTNVRPVVFPPNWRDSSNTSCYGPSVLLSFDSPRYNTTS
jgi:hypothetical protein